MHIPQQTRHKIFAKLILIFVCISIYNVWATGDEAPIPPQSLHTKSSIPDLVLNTKEDIRLTQKQLLGVHNLFIKTTGRVILEGEGLVNGNVVIDAPHVCIEKGAQGLFKVLGYFSLTTKDFTTNGTVCAEKGAIFHVGHWLNQGSFSVFGEGLNGSIETLKNLGGLETHGIALKSQDFTNFGKLKTRGHFNLAGRNFNNGEKAFIFTTGVHQVKLDGRYVDSGICHAPHLLMISADYVHLKRGHRLSLTNGLITSQRQTDIDKGSFFDLYGDRCFLQVLSEGQLSYGGTTEQYSSAPFPLLNYFERSPLSPKLEEFAKEVQTIPLGPWKDVKKKLGTGFVLSAPKSKLTITGSARLEGGSIPLSGHTIDINTGTVQAGYFNGNTITLHATKALLTHATVKTFFDLVQVTAKASIRIEDSLVDGGTFTCLTAPAVQARQSRLFSTSGSVVVGDTLHFADSRLIAKQGPTEIQGGKSVSLERLELAGTHNSISAAGQVVIKESDLRGTTHQIVAQDVSLRDVSMQGTSALRASHTLAMANLKSADPVATISGMQTIFEGDVLVQSLVSESPYIVNHAHVKTQKSMHLRADVVEQRKTLHAGSDLMIEAREQYVDEENSRNQAGNTLILKTEKTPHFKGVQIAPTAVIYLQNMALKDLLQQVKASTIEAHLGSDVIIDQDLLIAANLYLWTHRFVNNAHITTQQDLCLYVLTDILNHRRIDIGGTGEFVAHNLVWNSGTISTGKKLLIQADKSIATGDFHGQEGVKVRARIFQHARPSKRHQRTITETHKTRSFSGRTHKQTTERVVEEIELLDGGRMTTGPYGKIDIEAEEGSFYGTYYKAGTGGIWVHTLNHLLSQHLTEVQYTPYAVKKNTIGGSYSETGFIRQESAHLPTFHSDGPVHLSSDHTASIQAVIKTTGAGKQGQINIAAPLLEFPGVITTNELTPVLIRNGSTLDKRVGFCEEGIVSCFHAPHSSVTISSQGAIKGVKPRIDSLESHINGNTADLIDESLFRSRLRHETTQYAVAPAIDPELATVVGAVVTIATWGSGSALAGMLGFAEGSLGATLVSAASSTLISQSAVSMLANHGDLHGVLKDLTSESSLRSLGITLATAGLMQRFGIQLDPQRGFQHHLQYHVQRSLISTSLHASLGRRDLRETLKEELLSALANAVGTFGANQIGKAYYQGNLNTVTHKFAHASLGAVTGAILNRDAKRGALSGAMGSFVAETFADILSPEKPNSRIKAIEAAKGRKLSPQEFAYHYTIALEDYDRRAHNVADWAKIVAVTTTLLARQDVNTALSTATTAIDNNYLQLAYYGIVGAGLAYSAYEVHSAYREGGPEAALQQLGIEVALDVTGAAALRLGGKIVYKVGKVTYPTVEAAMTAVFDKNPGLKLFLGRLSGKLVTAGEKIAEKVSPATIAPVSKKTTLGGALRKDAIPEGSKLEYLAPGRVKFDGVEFRGVRDLGHLSEDQLWKMYRKGINPTDINGIRLDGHHFAQQYHRKPGTFMVEIPEPNHCISNTVQHPLGKSSGLASAERGDWDILRVKVNKARAETELIRRSLLDVGR